MSPPTSSSIARLCARRGNWNMNKNHLNNSLSLNRRSFIKPTSLVASASALGFLPVSADEGKVPGLKRKIKLGLVGCGGRGSWIATLFQKHGGFEFHAVADYFQVTAEKCGDNLGVDNTRRFSTLSGYKRLI